MAYPVPSLSVEGFVKPSDRKCDRILINLFACDAGQSNVFRGQVVSVQDIIYRNSDDVFNAGTEIAASIQRVLNSYFDAAMISASVKELVDKPGRYNIIINGHVVENNRRYDFGRQVEAANGMVVRMLTEQGESVWMNPAAT